MKNLIFVAIFLFAISFIGCDYNPVNSNSNTIVDCQHDPGLVVTKSLDTINNLVHQDLSGNIGLINFTNVHTIKVVFDYRRTWGNFNVYYIGNYTDNIVSDTTAFNRYGHKELIIAIPTYIWTESHQFYQQVGFGDNGNGGLKITNLKITKVN